MMFVPVIISIEWTIWRYPKKRN